MPSVKGGGVGLVERERECVETDRWTCSTKADPLIEIYAGIIGRLACALEQRTDSGSVGRGYSLAFTYVCTIMYDLPNSAVGQCGWDEGKVG